MNPLCKYKNALGEANKGIHSIRLFGVAIVDVVLTIVFAGIISHTSSYRFVPTLLFLFLLGIILHKLFCVDTAINNILFH